MKTIDDNRNLPVRQDSNEENNILPGYPTYPSTEDIYSKYRKEIEINPEDISSFKEMILIEKTETNNEKDFNEDLTGSDLDVPGSELDDELEEIGSEDEENNYYSLGGDAHVDLEENKEVLWI